MRTPPEGLADADLARALDSGWGLQSDVVAYLPVGFGSHHWRVEPGPWFVTADDLEARGAVERDPLGRLRSALRTARALRVAGLACVVGPEPTAAGDMVEVVDGRFAVALYPCIEGLAHGWGPYPSREHRASVLDAVAAVHGATGVASEQATADDLAILGRDAVHAALDDLAGPWTAGPHGEAARAALAGHAGAVEGALARYDALVAAVGDRPERLVVTHGEPHPGNTLTTAAGVVLVDWDTTLLAPPERDLWMLVDGAPWVLERYADATGVAADPDALALFALRWDLGDLAAFLAELRGPHRATEDTAASLHHLGACLLALSGGGSGLP